MITPISELVVDQLVLQAAYSTTTQWRGANGYKIAPCIAKTIEDQIKAPIWRKWTGWSFIEAGAVLGKHKDHHRAAALNIPIAGIGDFSAAPLVFYNENGVEIASYDYPCPALLDVNNITHAVDNSNGPDRLLLSIGFDFGYPYQDLVDLHAQGLLIG